MTREVSQLSCNQSVSAGEFSRRPYFFNSNLFSHKASDSTLIYLTCAYRLGRVPGSVNQLFCQQGKIENASTYPDSNSLESLALDVESLVSWRTPRTHKRTAPERARTTFGFHYRCRPYAHVKSYARTAEPVT